MQVKDIKYIYLFYIIRNDIRMNITISFMRCARREKVGDVHKTHVGHYILTVVQRIVRS